MPAGQFLGPKSKYIYTSDTGQNYIITRDDDLALAGSGLTAFDPENPPADAQPAPKRFRPRGVHWEATAAPIGARKYLICGTPTSDWFDSDATQAITIDGVAGRTTGRSGEDLSF